jgi:hypothetical protein
MKTYKKITSGFVTQTFCAETNRPISQNFTAGGEVDYENEQGDTIDASSIIEKEQYLPYDMVQPKEETSNKKYLVSIVLYVGEHATHCDAVMGIEKLNAAEIEAARVKLAAKIFEDTGWTPSKIIFTSFILLDE